MTPDPSHDPSIKQPTARILEIQRLSTEDGPGIRSTVFFKGCSLTCRWCHNPESISSQPQTHWIETHCIGCGLCVEACPNQALTLSAHGVSIDRRACRGCGDCAEVCPTTSMALLGKTWTLDALVSEVLKDRAYFESGGGGITVSGGEPALQARFVAPFLERLSQEGVHTALDTCGAYATRLLEQLLPHTRLVLYDLKEIDPRHHREFTGRDNQRILDNLIYVAEYIENQAVPPKLWIRTPIIPGSTDREENIRGIGGFLARHLKGHVERWELCAFNDLCKDKYRRLDQSWSYENCNILDAQRFQSLVDEARGSGIDPHIVHASGSTRSSQPLIKSSNRLPLENRQVANGS